MRFTRGAAEPVRYRACVSRLGEAKMITHLGQIELLRRAVVASGLPAVMDGKKKRPRPRLAFGPAISVGHESLSEYFDLELLENRPAGEVEKALAKVLENGYEVRKVRRIPRFFPSLDSSINVVRYEVRGGLPDDSGRSLEGFLSRKEIIIEKKKDGGARIERIDARPLIIEMRQEGGDALSLSLRFGPRRTVKPEALLAAWLGREAVAPARPDPHDPSRTRFDILRKELLSETSKGEFLAP